MKTQKGALFPFLFFGANAKRLSPISGVFATSRKGSDKLCLGKQDYYNCHVMS
jgi:hypothetical protein